jgi:hypothetical protein
MVASASASRMPQRPSKTTLRAAGEVEGEVVSRRRAQDPGGEFPGIITLEPAPPDGDEDRVDLFRVPDGDGFKVYSMATTRSANVSLKYTWLAREKGQAVAYGYALETLIGSEGYGALMNYDGLRQEDLDAIIAAASKIMAGPAEPDEDEDEVPPKGKRRRA